MHYYTLAVGAPVGGPSSAPGPLVGVRHFHVDPPFDQDRIVHRISGSAEVAFYDSHRWAAPLGRLLPLAIVELLAATPGLGRVETVVPQRHYDAFLEGRVLQLEELDSTPGATARVRLSLELRDSSGTLLWRRIAAAESTSGVSGVAETVDCIRKALAVALAEMTPDLVAALDG